MCLQPHSLISGKVWVLCDALLFVALQYGAPLPIYILKYLISGCLFFSAGAVLECNLANCRTLAVLCILFKIKSNPMHPLNSAWPLPRVPSRVTSSALVVYKHSYGPPGWNTYRCSRTFVPFSVSLGNDRSDPVFDAVGLSDFKSRVHAFLLA